jgi:L-lactate permease
MAVIGLVFGVAYAVSSILRGNVLAGLVAGALGAVLVFVVLLRVQEQHAARRRREREGPRE